MAQLKKVLAGSFAVLMAASMMTACGKDDSSNGGSNGNGGSDWKYSGDLKEPKAEPVKQNKEGSADSKKKLVICTWNEEFKNRLRAFYPDYDKTASKMTGETDDKGNFIVGDKEYLKDGTEIVWKTTTSEGNAYQDKLDTDLKAQADSEDKIDMFLVEADYALKYVNGPYVMPVKEVGLTDDDLKDQYKYTKDVVTDSKGDLQGVSWQATPGLFAYRRDIAKEVLGTDDPTEVQAKISNWDDFNKVAEQMKAKGYFMLSGYDDSYRTFSNNVTKCWVDSEYKVHVDDNLMKWVDQTKEYSDKGYNNKTSLWDKQWGADQGKEGKVFGFFYSTWGINFTLMGNSLAKAVKDGGKEEVGNGLYGEYRVCEGPAAFFWGGTWLCCAAGSDNTDTVADIMKKMTCDKDIAKQLTLDTLDYTNNKSAMQEIADDATYGSAFLGGQNHIKLFAAAAPNIKMDKTTMYDQGLNEAFQAAFKDYFTGNADKDKALENFYKAAIEKYPKLKKAD